MLNFDRAWRRSPPPDGRFTNQRIPSPAFDAYFGLILRLTMQGSKQAILESFKRVFAAAAGESYYRSSGAGWAETDLRRSMESLDAKPPLFLEALWQGFQVLNRDSDSYPDLHYVPAAAELNEIAEDHRIGYWIEPPNLLLREDNGFVVEVEARPTTLRDQAIEQIETSLYRSQELLQEGNGREAVQEALWLLETISTAFRGVETAEGTVSGRYFNSIARELRRFASGTTLDRVLEWVTSLHGYLSSPTGGGVRHGADLREGVPLGPSEARLYCNLIRSYTSFLIDELNRMDQSA